MFADITRWNNDFCFADIVVLQEHDFEKITNIFIRIDDLADLVDEMDDCLSHPVARRCLTAENTYAWLSLLTILGRHVLQLQVPVYDTEDV